MKKDFHQWAKEKESLENIDSREILCKKREIWIAKIGVNIGNEVSKENPFLRPVIILETHLGGDLILIAPLTSQYNKFFDKYLLPIENKKLLKKSFIQVNQIKIISKKRLERNLDSKISSQELEIIKNRLQEKILKPRLNGQSHSDMNQNP